MNHYRKNLRPVDMQATYLTRSVNKIFDAEFPVGDPFSGPAYGEKEFKLRKALGVVAAVAAIAVAGPVALAGGLTAASVSAGLVVAGSALSIAGVATGNEKLGRIGAVLGIAGGIGMAVTSATQAGGLASTLEETATAGAQASEEIATSNAIDMGVPKPVAETGAVTAPQTGVVDAVEEGLTQQVGPDDLAGVDSGAEFLDGAAGNAGGSSRIEMEAARAANPQSVYGDAPGTSPLDIASNQASYQSQYGSGGLINSAKDFASGLGQFAKENKELAFLGGTTLTSAIGGAAEASAKEEAETRARQQALDDRQYYNDSIKGLRSQYDYANVRSPYGNAPINPVAFLQQQPSTVVYDPQLQKYVPARQGLIANNMPRTA